MKAKRTRAQHWLRATRKYQKLIASPTSGKKHLRKLDIFRRRIFRMNRAWKLGITTASLLAWLSVPSFGQSSVELSALDGTDGFTLVSTANYSRTGYAVAGAGDFNGDGFADLLVNGASPSATTFSQGAVHVVFGTSATQTSFSLSALDGTDGFTIVGQTYDYVGQTSLSTAGDFNGDGIDDIILGSSGRQVNGQFGAGSAFVIFGRQGSFAREFQTSDLNGTNGFVIEGTEAQARLGASVAQVGDLNQDGLSDIIVGETGVAANGAAGAGQAHVIFGSTSAFSTTFSPTELDGTNGFTINGEAAADGIGSAVDGAGDVNGDGRADLILGSAFADPITNEEGKAYIVFGKASFNTTFDLSSLSASEGIVLQGSDPREQMGRSVAGVGDLNGDGIDDVAIGSHVATANTVKSGKAYVFFGTTTSFANPISLASLDGTNGFVINGTEANEQVGKRLSRAGDFNQDGYKDLLIAAPSASFFTPAQTGKAYVLFGNSTWGSDFELSDINGTNGFVINGINNYDFAGEGVGFVGDFNQDGGGEIVVGASNFNGTTFPPTGAAYLIYGEAGAGLPMPELSLSTAVSATLEDSGNAITFTFSASITPTTDLSLNFSVTGTATFNNDYTLISGSNDFNGSTGTVTIPAGQTSVTLVFQAQQDAILEPDETIIVTIETP